MLKQFPSIIASVIYVDDQDVKSLAESTIPTTRHVAGESKNQSSLRGGVTSVKEYSYPSIKSQRWFSPGHEDFDYSPDAVAHTRNLQFLKPKMAGPYFDLESIWEEHTYYEFADRSVEHTMSTMVQEPYVNHVPTVS